MFCPSVCVILYLKIIHNHWAYLYKFWSSRVILVLKVVGMCALYANGVWKVDMFFGKENHL